MKISAPGFTLIELLVVIAIIGIISTVAFSNYKSFGEDQNLKSAVLDVQSLLRQAQTNATTNVICDTEYGATWKVEFATIYTVNLKCSASPVPKKTLTMGTNITMKIGEDCAALPFTASFAPLTGNLDLGSCNSRTVTLNNSKTTSNRTLIIEKGGRIYEQ